MRLLADMGVPNHFVSELSEREVLVRAVEIVPLEVIVRNVAAGSFAARLRRRRGHRVLRAHGRVLVQKRRAGRPADQLLACARPRLGERVGDRADRRPRAEDRRDSRQVLEGAGGAPRRFQGGVRAPSRRRGDPRRRDKPRHVPVVGCRNRGSSGQGPLPPPIWATCRRAMPRRCAVLRSRCRTESGWGNDQVRIRDRRRGLGAGEGHHGRVPRQASESARAARRRAEARSLPQRRSGDDPARTSTARSTSPRTAPKPIWTWGTTSVSSTRISTSCPTSRRARCTTPCSTRSGAVRPRGRPFRSSRM